jgi:uncharacterized coiled-coil protein SlyX
MQRRWLFVLCLVMALAALGLPPPAGAQSPEASPASGGLAPPGSPGEQLPAAGGQAPPQSPGQDTLASVLDLVREQRDVIDRQQETIDALEKRLDEVESLALSSHNRLEELDERAPDADVGAAVEERLAELESSIEALPEKTDIVSAGEFPGSFKIPGTDAAMKIGGQVRFTGINSFDAIGSEDRFVTSSIPIAGTEDAGKESRVTYIASPSRLNFDMRTPTGVGSMRAFIEADYAGSGGAFRLRHAFGQWRKFLIGQTWSTFADPEAEPDGIDFEGLNAISLFRKPQVRWTTPFGKRNSVSLALENPAPDVTGAAGLNQVPDVIARVRWEPERVRGPLRLLQGIGHVQAAAIVRQVRAEPAEAPNTTISTGGFGFNVSGRMAPGLWKEEDDLTWAVYAGRGIGSYINDLRTLGGQDAVYDPATDALEALPVGAAYVGYQHWWNTQLRSTATFGWVYVGNVDIQPGEALHQTVRYSINLSWSPIPRLDLVGEFLSGQRLNKNGDKGTASQWQFGTRFRF